ncbi:MAG: hypothetical protein O7G85_05970 [Planctomycetota bacterium]|nr:hypothetical protein [Planctomycetota bacterium]
MRQPFRIRLEMLKKESPETVENILLESLRHAWSDEIAPICHSLIQSGRPKAITTAMRHLDRLQVESLELLARENLDLIESARCVMRGTDLRPIPDVIRLIEQRHEASLLGELVRMLLLDRGVNSRPAAKAILNVTTYWLDQDPLSASRQHALSLIDDAIAEALDTYRDHRCRDILITAAQLCMQPGPKLRSMLEDAEDPMHSYLRSVAEDLHHPIVRKNLLRWLDSPWLGRSVARWLHTLKGTESWSEVLRESHLLRLKSKRQALGQADKAMRCLPTRNVMTELDDESQVGLTDYILALGAPTQAKARTLGDLATLGKPRTRVHALLGVLSLECPEVDTTILSRINDSKPAIVRIAARNVMARRSLATQGNMIRLEQSPHDSIARLASHQVARSNVQLFFERWLGLPQAQRMVAAHRLYRVKRNAFLTGLRAKLEEGHEPSTLMAITVLRRMNLSVHCEASLVGLTFSDHVRIVASAVMALGEGGVHHGMQAVRAALHHQDPRVQANAVEALMRLHAPETADLVTFLTQSRDNRPRANAIVAFHRTRRGEGERLLSSMMRDSDPLHRVSAIWAARRCRGREMVHELERLADHDRLPEIRVRARAALRLITPHLTKHTLEWEHESC